MLRMFAYITLLAGKLKTFINVQNDGVEAYMTGRQSINHPNCISFKASYMTYYLRLRRVGICGHYINIRSILDCSLLALNGSAIMVLLLRELGLHLAVGLNDLKSRSFGN
jgi:hypothetical protein